MKIESVFYVNKYFINRAYGGPEEGGWWYDVGEFVEPAAMFTDEDEALVFCRGLNRALDAAGGENEGLPPLHSVTSTGRWSYMVEDRPGEDFPTYTPHYE